MSSFTCLVHLYVCFSFPGNCYVALLQVHASASASTSSTASLHAMATQELLDADHQQKEAVKNLQAALEAAELAEEDYQRASDYLQSVDKVLRWKIEHP